MVSRQSRKLRKVNLPDSLKQARIRLGCNETGQHNHLCIAACRLETETNMVMRFIIGQTQNDAQEAELMQESSKHGGFLRLDLQVPLAAPHMCNAADVAVMLP